MGTYSIGVPLVRTRENRGNTTNGLPPRLQAFASLLDVQPPEVQEAFQFLLATAMHKAGKFELLNVVEVELQETTLNRKGDRREGKI